MAHQYLKQLLNSYVHLLSSTLHGSYTLGLRWNFVVGHKNKKWFIKINFMPKISKKNYWQPCKNFDIFFWIYSENIKTSSVFFFQHKIVTAGVYFKYLFVVIQTIAEKKFITTHIRNLNTLLSALLKKWHSNDLDHFQGDF